MNPPPTLVRASDKKRAALMAFQATAKWSAIKANGILSVPEEHKHPFVRPCAEFRFRNESVDTDGHILLP